MPPLPSIACKECGHSNEGERLYCHECGSKLDRSAVLVQQKQRESKPEEVQERVKKIMNPSSGFFFGFFKTGLRTFVLAAACAALIDIAQAPRGVETKSDTEQLSTSVPRDALEFVANGRPGLRHTISEAEINGYLKGAVRMKTTGPLADYLKFDRVFTRVDDDAIEIFLQKSLVGHPLITSVKYRLAIVNNRLEATPLALSIGRLNLPPIAAAQNKYLFGTVWSGLKEERETMNRLGAVDLRKGMVIISARGTVPLPPAAAPEAVPAPAPATAPAAP